MINKHSDIDYRNKAIRCLRDYVILSKPAVNKELRLGEETEACEYLDFLCAQIPSEKKVLYRGINTSYLYNNPQSESLVWTETAFISTSTNIDTALNFRDINEGLMIIKPSDHNFFGIDVNKELDGGCNDESEVILSRKTRMKLDSIIHYDEQNTFSNDPRFSGLLYDNYSDIKKITVFDVTIMDGEPTHIFRPKWTCGRYSENKKVAIIYNLITGICYFFEDDSAMVIGEVLSLNRNAGIKIDTLSAKLAIDKDRLISFINELEEKGIVCTFKPTPKDISIYRELAHNCSISKKQEYNRFSKKQMPYTISTAEQLYTSKVGGITSAMLELTYRCSEKCIHCYNIGATRNDNENSLRGDREELTLNEYKKLIDELYNEGVYKVCLSGGDPFSKSIVWEIIDYLYKKDIAFDIFTNGQSIVNDVEKLADYFPRSVGVSIYSGIDKVHDYITRIPGSWEKTMSVIKKFSDYSVPMNLKCCIMQPNVKSYYQIAEIAKKYGALPQFEISVTDSIDGDKCVSKYLRLKQEQLEIVLRDERIPLYVGKEAPNYGGQVKPKNQNACGAGENSICITPEGNIIPCCAFHALFGNVKKSSISEIVKESESRNYWLHLTLNDYEECGKHNYCDYCNLCPGNNFVEHGNPLKASEVNCYMAKARYKLAKSMKQGYDPLNGKTLIERLDEMQDYKPRVVKRFMSKDFSDTKIK
ncbi:MAG: radical SAM protein [Bacteroidales bacterium]|nr:radical SAM protein [Bacteroidales bacterium]